MDREITQQYTKVRSVASGLLFSLPIELRGYFRQHTIGQIILEYYRIRAKRGTMLQCFPTCSHDLLGQVGIMFLRTIRQPVEMDLKSMRHFGWRNCHNI